MYSLSSFVLKVSTVMFASDDPEDESKGAGGLFNGHGPRTTQEADELLLRLVAATLGPVDTRMCGPDACTYSCHIPSVSARIFAFVCSAAIVRAKEHVIVRAAALKAASSYEVIYKSVLCSTLRNGMRASLSFRTTFSLISCAIRTRVAARAIECHSRAAASS